MTTPIRNKPVNVVQTRPPIHNETSTLLIYLYDVQSHIEWLAEDMARIRQQVATLRSIINDPRTVPFVGQTLTSALASSAEDIAELQGLDAMAREIRDRVEIHYEAFYPLGGSGIPPQGSQNHLASGAIEQLLHDRTGLTVLAAAAAIVAPSPRPTFLRPEPMPCTVRNTRLIRRYGYGVEECLSVDGVALNNAENGQPPPPGNSSVGGASAFPGAVANIQGDPAGVRTYTDAFYASWETQARLFATGSPVNNDINRRRFIFRDGSYVTIQAHVSARIRTDDSRFSETIVVCSVSAMGALAGGPAAAVAAGAAALATSELSYPNDAAWQGYTIHYYQPNAAVNAWATRYFYGWKRAPNISLRVRTPKTTGAGTGVEGAVNFADHVSEFSWWKWKSGVAETAKQQPKLSNKRVETETQRLIELVAGMTSLGSSAPMNTSADPTEVSARLSGLTTPYGNPLKPPQMTRT